MTTPRLIFDIETKLNMDAIGFLDEPKAPGNYKDPEKIAAYVEEKRNEQISRMALDPDYGRIVSLGYCVTGTQNEASVLLANDDMVDDIEESSILEIFWDMLDYCNGNCVGYNIIGFDLPYIMRRSMALGVSPSRPPLLAKYRTEPVTDLMGILYNWGPAKSLKKVCEMYNIPVPADGVDGSMVANMTTEQLIEYQRSDVEVTLALFNKMNGVYFDL